MVLININEFSMEKIVSWRSQYERMKRWAERTNRLLKNYFCHPQISQAQHDNNGNPRVWDFFSSLLVALSNHQKLDFANLVNECQKFWDDFRGALIIRYISFRLFARPYFIRAAHGQKQFLEAPFISTHKPKEPENPFA